MQFIGWHVHAANEAGATLEEAQRKRDAQKTRPAAPNNRPTKQQIVDLYEAAVEAGDTKMQGVWFDAYNDLKAEEAEIRFYAQYDADGYRIKD